MPELPAGSVRGVVQQAHDRVRQRLRIVRRDEQAGLAVLHGLADPADRSRDDRDAGSLRLDDGET